MGAITAELVDTGERRGASGRRVTPLARRASLVEEFGRSGMTMAAFARREGIKYSTFAVWVQRDPRRPAARGAGAIKFAEVRLPTPPAPNPEERWEVRLPDGTIVRGGRVADVVTLLRALRT